MNDLKHLEGVSYMAWEWIHTLVWFISFTKHSLIPNEKSFFCTAAVYVPGDKGDFFHSENSHLNIITERVTDHMADWVSS